MQVLPETHPQTHELEPQHSEDGQWLTQDRTLLHEAKRTGLSKGAFLLLVSQFERAI